MQSLCPGYRQVDSFGAEDEYENDEEVSYVTLDLGAAVEPILVASSSNYRLIGLDTPTPFLQLSGTIFKGEYDRLLGSELLFTESKDQVESSRKHFCLVSAGLSEQRIRFREVEVKRKSPSSTDVDLASVSPPNEKSVSQPRSAVAGPSTSKLKENVNQMTGKEVLAPRKARGKEARKAKSKGKGKEKATEDDIDHSELVEGFGIGGTGDEDDFMMTNPVEDPTFIPDDGMAMDLG